MVFHLVASVQGQPSVLTIHEKTERSTTDSQARVEKCAPGSASKKRKVRMKGEQMTLEDSRIILSISLLYNEFWDNEINEGSEKESTR